MYVHDSVMLTLTLAPDVSEQPGGETDGPKVRSEVIALQDTGAERRTDRQVGVEIDR